MFDECRINNLLLVYKNNGDTKSYTNYITGLGIWGAQWTLEETKEKLRIKSVYAQNHLFLFGRSTMKLFIY